MSAGDRITVSESDNVVRRKNDGANAALSRTVRNILIHCIAISMTIAAGDCTGCGIEAKRNNYTVSTGNTCGWNSDC
jgi:hypothetical protein